MSAATRRASTAPASATATANVSGYIGAQGGSASFLAGGIDDVAVYNSALSATSITNHYKAARYGPPPQ